MEIARELATGAMLPSACNRSNDCEIVRRWMEMVLGDTVLSDVPAALQSGQVLCDLVKKLYQALGMKSHVRSCDGDDVDALSKVLEYLRYRLCVGEPVGWRCRRADSLVNEGRERVGS